MSVNVKFNASYGIGWQNALGVCFAQVDHHFAPTRVVGALQRQSVGHQQGGLFRTLKGWQPEPAKVDEWLKIMIEDWPFEERYRSAKLKLKIYSLTSPGTVETAAVEVLKNMTFEVMFYDAINSSSLPEGTAMVLGARYSGISELLSSSSKGIYSMAEELRSDSELLQSEEEGKVLFAKMAYLSLIPHFQFGELLDYEIDSILQVAMNRELSKASRDAAREILDKLTVYLPRSVEQRAHLLAQEYRREINVDIFRQPWDETRMIVENYGYATTWLPRGSAYVTDELQDWRAILGTQSPSHAMAAIVAASYLVINLPRDGRGKAMLRDVADEAFIVIGSGSFHNASEAAGIIFPRILLASEYNPQLAFHIASKLREVALNINRPLIFTAAYASALEYVDTTRLAEEVAILQNIRKSTSLLRETLDAVEAVLRELD